MTTPEQLDDFRAFARNAKSGKVELESARIIHALLDEVFRLQGELQTCDVCAVFTGPGRHLVVCDVCHHSVRRQSLEEAAKVVDHFSSPTGLYDPGQVRYAAAIAARIRALITKPEEG